MILFQAFLVLFAAVSISGIAAYVSVTGMMAVFPASAITVAIIMTCLEFGKIVAVEWLHSNWKNPLVGWLHKTYMVLAVLALMTVTAIGIYGFFSKGYLEQSQPSKEAALHITQLQTQIAQKEADQARLDTRIQQLDQTVERALSGRSDLSATRATQLRNQQKSERNEISSARKDLDTEIKQLRDELVPLQMTNLAVEAKLGPVKYLASLFGFTDENSAVQIIIMVLMFAFDPFAISLVICSSISFKTWSASIRKKEDAQLKDQPAVEEFEIVAPAVVAVHDDAPKEQSEVGQPPPCYYPKDEPCTLVEQNVPTVVDAEIEAPTTAKPVKINRVARRKKEQPIESGMTTTEVAASYLSEHERDKIIAPKK